jgi:outer membrane lipase/esterase
LRAARPFLILFCVQALLTAPALADVLSQPGEQVFINDPNNLLTDTTGDTILLATDNVGIFDGGTLVVNNGSRLFAGTVLSAPFQGAANLLLTGTGSRIEVRRANDVRGEIFGSGTWQILDGAVFDAGDAASCTTTLLTCGVSIGIARGANPNLLVSGAGSQFISIDVLSIGANNPIGPAQLGDVNATVTVSGGGRIESEDVLVGVAVSNDPSGLFRARGTANITGAGSVWNANSFVIGRSTGSEGAVNVSSGGVLNVAGLLSMATTEIDVTGVPSIASMTVSDSGSQVSAGSMDVSVFGEANVLIQNRGVISVASMLRIGLAGTGATGAMTVSGTASSLLVGNDLIVGLNDEGTGLLSILAGGDVRVGGAVDTNFTGTFLGVGVNGGTGRVDLNASTLTVEAPASNSLARLHVGDGGNGTLNLTNTSTLRVLKTDVSPIGDGLIIGRNLDAGRGVGTVVVDSATLIGQSPLQVFDIGVNNDLGNRLADSDGTLRIINQGLVRIDGQTGIARLRMGRGEGAVGTLVVDNGRLEVIGNDAAMFVGHDLAGAIGNGVANMSVLNGGRVTVRGASPNLTTIIVGLGSGNATLTVDSGGVIDLAGTLSISRASPRNDIQTALVDIGAGGTINTQTTVIGNRGTLQGTGRLNARLLRVQSGGTLNLTSLDGVDELSLEGVQFSRTDFLFGRNNAQTLSVSGGAVIDVGNALTFGTAAGTRATVNASGAGTLLRTAGGLALGNGTTPGSTLRLSQGARANIEGGTIVRAGSTLTVSGNGTTLTSLANLEVGGTFLVEEGGTAQVGGISVLNGGLIGGTGTISSTGPSAGLVVGSGGTLAPGNSAGTLNVNGNVTLATGGRFLFELGGTQSNQFDVLNVTGDVDLQGGTFELQLINGFTPSSNDSFDLITATGATNISPGVTFVSNGLGPDFEFVFRQLGNLSVGSIGFLAVDIQELIGLSPNQTAMAIYMDGLCPRIEALAAPTVDQGDLDLICGGLRNGNNSTAQVASSLDALMPDEILGIIDTLLRFTTVQHGNLSQRLSGLRNGAARIDLSGLDFVSDNMMIAGSDLQKFVEPLTGGSAGADEDFARWGFFSDGNFHFGDQSQGVHETGFDFDTVNLTFGLDYRVSNNLFLGAAAGYNEINADFDTGGGLQMKAMTLALMGTYFRGESFYVDVLATYGIADADTSRFIQYTNAGGTVDRRATGDTDGREFVATVGSGYDFVKGPWVIGPHGGANYTEVVLDKYEEFGAFGANLSLSKQASRSMTANAGAHASYTFTPAWGVLVPHARIDYVHEFQHRGQFENVSFVADRFRFDPSNPLAPARLQTDDAERNYWSWSVGAHAQFVGGIAAFVNYRGHLGLGRLDLSEVSIGLRFERQF